MGLVLDCVRQLLYIGFLGFRYLMGIYKEVVDAYFSVLFQNLTDEADETNETLQSGGFQTGIVTWVLRCTCRRLSI